MYHTEMTKSLLNVELDKTHNHEDKFQSHLYNIDTAQKELLSMMACTCLLIWNNTAGGRGLSLLTSPSQKPELQTPSLKGCEAYVYNSIPF